MSWEVCGSPVANMQVKATSFLPALRDAGFQHPDIYFWCHFHTGMCQKSLVGSHNNNRATDMNMVNRLYLTVYDSLWAGRM